MATDSIYQMTVEVHRDIGRQGVFLRACSWKTSDKRYWVIPI